MSVVSVETRDNLAIVTIDSPPVNALSQAVRAGIVSTLDEAEGSGAEAVVLHCAGRTFVAGADIREFGKPPKPPWLPEVIARIEACGRPVVAALHGTTLGGGLELALGCHYRIAVPTARVGFPEVHLGLIPGAGGTQRLPRLVGAERALDMMISGKPVNAAEAAAMGIVDRLAQSGNLLDEAMNFARELVAGGEPPRLIRDLSVQPVDTEFFTEYRKRIARKTRGLMSPERIVRCVEASLHVLIDQALKEEREHFFECMASPQSSALRHLFFAERQAVKPPPGVSAASKVPQIRRIAVIGAGTMGAGIAYSCLGAGYEVTVLDNDESGLARGQTTIKGLYEGGVARGKVSREKAEDGLGRLTTSQEYAAVAEADLVIEAVFESMAVKREVFARLDRVCGPDAILATNTSTLDVDRIAAATDRPGKVIGTHFFSPAHIMRLVEIVRGAQTGDSEIVTALALAKRLRKVGVVVGNCFGFVGNRMLYGYGRESQLLLLEGAAPEQIDGALQDWGMAMGPHAMGDLAGLDVGYSVRRERTDSPDDPRFYRMADVLVEAGRLGRKTGKGMYLYESGSRAPIPDPDVDAWIAREAEALGVERRTIGEQEIVERCIYALIVEGARILEEGIASRSGDIDVVWVNGYGFPRYRGGPMHFADTIGVDKVYARVCEFRDRFGPMYWEVPELLEDLGRHGAKFADLKPAG
ncbi:MAG: 3-hydroxyacyl-CoA dehydrogenase NAD-binding domain-containing protein [Rhodospirillaceae bacterium]|nr:3-hydroxyacyl-CoA dehydrogenase NAD-binding domain-containing protein [Rhodospirillaceae bacterium]MDE0001001.1 3-hydroxyacyl-CoA dehydrogenase NAD-binding domain-containing protein [Rhodospirillaceae bacterium]